MPYDLDRDPVILLNLVGRLLRVMADKRAREHGMSRAQWMILVWVNKEPGMTQQAMSDILEVEPISVGRLVDKLEARGLIERRRDPKDRRVWRLHNLPAAKPILKVVEGMRSELNQLILARLGPDKIEALLDTLFCLKTGLMEERTTTHHAAVEPSNA